MNPLLTELDAVVVQGVALADNLPSATEELSAWLGRRGLLFAEIDRLVAQVDEADSSRWHFLIDEIRQLDARIIAAAEREMRRLAREIVGAQKLRGFLAGGVRSAPHSFLDRSF